MSEEEVKQQNAQQAIDDSTMEYVIDKLKLLNYETEFCQTVKPPFKLLSKFYFTGPSTIENPNTQFYYFISLCSWLMKLCGHTFETPGQFDDPNASATTILAELRTMKVSIPTIAPNRIKQGSGDAVITILSALVDHALESRGFAFLPIDYAKMEKFDECSNVIEGDEVENAMDVEDNVVIDSDDDDTNFVRATTNKGNQEPINAPVISSVNAEEWNLEVERVAPLLKVGQEINDNWRSRVEGAKVLLKAVKKMYPEVKQMLERVGDDMENSKSRIEKREQTLATQFSDDVELYRSKLRELNNFRTDSSKVSQAVQYFTTVMAESTKRLDEIKVKTEDLEAKLSDPTPCKKIKDAVNKVKNEIKQMELRIGVLQNSVMMYVIQQMHLKRERLLVEREDSVAEDEKNFFSFD